MNIMLDTLRKEEQVTLILRQLFESRGYKKFRMSKFEEYNFYIENKNFLQSNQIITFNDVDGRLMALKPDVTLSIVKNTKATEAESEKLYYTESIYRMNMQGREYKEITQTGLEYIGKITSYTNVEVITLALQSLKAIHENYILDISHMGYIMGMIDEIIDEISLKNALIECIKEKNLHELEYISKKGGISAENIERLKELIKLSGEFAPTLEKARKYILNDQMKTALYELENLSIIDTANMRLDFSIINDMNYYNGIIFRGYVECVPKAVLSGGRYDNLLEKMGKENLNAIGFAVYFDEFDRYMKSSAANKIDVIILYNEKSDLKKLISVSEELSKSGSVLVCENIPSDTNYARMEDLRV